MIIFEKNDILVYTDKYGKKLKRKVFRIMNKSQIIDSVVKETGLKKKDAEAAVNAVFQTIENALCTGEKVQLVGFGTFEVKERAERAGINPATREPIIIPASKHLSFAAGKTLKANLNK